MDKSQRNYKLYISPDIGPIILIDFSNQPFTIEFDITRNNLQSTNVASIKIYNLAEKTRKRIAKEDYTYDGTESTRILIQLDAGYGKSIYTIFKGNASHAWSYRNGVDFITQIEAFDGGDALINSVTNQTFEKGTPTSAVLAAAVGDMSKHEIQLGYISKTFDAETLKRGNAVSGNSADIASNLSRGAFFIDNGKAYVLKNTECLSGIFNFISSSTGLLGTPIRSNNKTSIDILFEPRVKMCQLITLQSITRKDYNGLYKVVSIKHHGMISYSVSGDAITSLELWKGPDGKAQFQVVA